MSPRVVCRQLTYVVAAWIGTIAGFSYAANGTWNSTAAGSNAFWTNTANWSASPYPAGNQTAVFNNNGNGRTTLDLTGLTFGCSNIVFDTASAAAYTLGSNGVNQQTLMFTNNSNMRLSATVVNPQRVNAITMLGNDRAASTHVFRNEQPFAPLILAGDVNTPSTTGTAGTKTVNLPGIGDITISGNIQQAGGSGITLNAQTLGNLLLTGSNRVGTVTCTGGTVTLSGTNRIDTLNVNTDNPITFSGTNIVQYCNINGSGNAVINVAAGTLYFSSAGGTSLVAYQNSTINGPGAIWFSVNTGENWTDNSVANGKTCVINAKITGYTGFEYYGSTYGTFVFAGLNDHAGITIMNAPGTISVSKIGNKGSTTSNLGRNNEVGLNAIGCRLLYTGTGETSDRTVRVSAGGTIEHAGTGHLKFTSPINAPAVTPFHRRLTLHGNTSGTGEFAGVILNGSGAVALYKTGTGTWSLTTNNTYTGVTVVGGGTLALSGANGTLANSTSSYSVVSGTLLLNNTSSANNTNRLGDTTPILLGGGTLSFSSDAGSANFGENAGALTLNPGNSTIATVQAAVGQTATLRFASLTRNMGATVDFTGEGLGQSDRNRIYITAGTPEGLIGPWATVNGTNLAAYSAANGVYAADDSVVYTDIAAYGDTIVSNDASLVRINTFGTSGAIALDSPTTRITALVQNTEYAATVNTADKTLQTAVVSVPEGKASVTVGAAANDGTLSTIIPNGELALNSGVANGLTVNAVITDNGAASKLTKYGTGSVTLAGTNTFSGTVSVYAGSLALANTLALQNVTLTATGTVFDSSVASGAFTLANISGSFGLPLYDNAGTPNPVALTVGGNSADAFYSGVLSGPGSLVKSGNGTLTLSGLNSFNGGLTIQSGTVVASNAYALGFGGLVNNGLLLLPLTAGTLYYSGITNSMSGAGTVNVWLATGTSTTWLNGDYSGFTGAWNIGTNAVPGASKVMMNGLDNPAATLNLMTHGAVMIGGTNTHYATAVLNGGDTGESIGQLRMDAGTAWAGPVMIAGPMTATGDGHIGGNTGQSIISGVITNTVPGITLEKAGGATNYFTANNTYAGPTWIKNGGIRVDTIGSVGGGASPLGNPTSIAEGTIRFGTINTNGSLMYTGNGETTDRVLEMAGTTATTYLWHSGSNVLTFAGDVVSSVNGNKRLTLHGTTVGATGVISGVISDYGTASTNNLYKAGPVTWMLTANNTFKGNVVLEDGTLRVTASEAFGNWPKTVQSANNANGCNPHIVFDGTAGDLTFPTNITFRTSNVRGGAIINEGGTNTILGPVNLTSGDGDTILNSAVGKLVVAGNVWPPTDTGRQLRLHGDGDGEISGVIANGATAALPVYRMVGSGTWTLSASNTYGGITYANNGTLVIGGADGFVGGGVTVNPTGTFVVANNALSNSLNRLGDLSTVTLNGGVFSYSHTGGAVNYSELTGPLVVGAGTNRLVTSQADESQSSILSFASLTRSANGTIDFQGAGLGFDDRNKVMFTNPPPEGLIGLWASYNATNFAAYNNTLGVVAAGDAYFTDVPARGPYEIASGAALNVRITDPGTDGPLALQGLPTSDLSSLMQNSPTNSVIGMTNQTLRVSDVMIAADQGDLTLGTAENEGLLMAPAAGGMLVLINNSSATLTLNAAVTNNTSASKLGKVGPGLVKLNGRNSYTGTTTINEGVLEFGGSSTQALAGVISGPGTLVKSGSGTLGLSAANTYTGPTIIREGVLVANIDAPFGNNATGTFVEAGATLDVGSTQAADQLDIGVELITASGAGVGGLGAIVNNSTKGQMNAISKLALAGDTTFGGVQRWDFRNNAPTITMNGYLITKVGPNFVNLSQPAVYPDGEGGTGDIDVKAGSFGMDGAVKLNGSSDNTMTVRSGAKLQTWNVGATSNAMPWTLILEAGSTNETTQSGLNSTANVWTGPVTLNGTAILTGANTGWGQTFSGEISGGGSIFKTGVSFTYLTGSNNTYLGTTAISNGTLVAKYPGSLPGYDSGKVTVCGSGTLAIPAGDGVSGWSADQLKALHDASTFVNNAAVLSVDTALNGIDYTSDLTKTLSLVKQSNNTLALYGTNAFTGAVTVNAGTLAFAGPSNVVGNMTLNNASVTTFGGPSFTTNGTVTINNSAALTYGADTTNNSGGITVYTLGTLNFAAGSTSTVAGVTARNASLVNVDGELSLRNSDMTVGNTSGDRPTVTLNNNAYLNKLYVGNGALSAGAVIQNSGDLTVNPAQGGQDVLTVGRAGGYGYYRMNGGTITAGQLAITGNGAGLNNAVIDQFAGDVRVTSTSGWFIWGWQGGAGVYNLFDGTVANPPSGNDPTMAFTVNRNCFGMFNLLGPNAVANTTVNTRNLQLAAQAGNMASVVNLNAGTLIANRVIANSALTPTFLNFNGGTLRANTAQAQFLQGLSFATVYPGGAVIDSSNVNVTVNQSLRAPTGYGVSSVAVSSGGWGYIGAPVVLMSGGSGTGATAIATVDLNPASPTRSRVTGITVTSPGTGYQASDVLDVSLLGGGYTNNMLAIARAYLSPNDATGGLTKQGAGVLTLGGTNTYGGTTTLSSGTLKLASTTALPTGTEVLFAGGTLDLSGLTFTNTLNVAGAVSGSITNGTFETVISPAGEHVIGTQTFGLNVLNAATLRATYYADVALGGACDVLAVQGDINLSHVSLHIVDPDLLDQNTRRYTLLTCTGSRTGTIASTDIPDKRWIPVYPADGSVQLVFLNGTMIKVK